jgi:hypothetical protein
VCIHHQVARQLWRRVGRNMDLVQKLRLKKMKKMRNPMDIGDADLVEVILYCIILYYTLC